MNVQFGKVSYDSEGTAFLLLLLIFSVVLNYLSSYTSAVFVSSVICVFFVFFVFLLISKYFVVYFLSSFTFCFRLSLFSIFCESPLHLFSRHNLTPRNALQIDLTPIKNNIILDRLNRGRSKTNDKFAKVGYDSVGTAFVILQCILDLITASAEVPQKSRRNMSLLQIDGANSRKLLP